MNDLPPGDHAAELYCFPVGLPSEGRFAFLPAAPALAIEQDVVKASLLSSAAGAVLAFEAVWQADDASIEAARAVIASRHPEIGSIDLRAADLADVTATLTVDAEGRTHVAGPCPASGTSSNRVAFTTALTSAEKRAAIGAFQGNAGVLTLRYTARLSLDASAAAAFAGDLTEVVKALTPPPVAEQSGGFFSRKKPPSPAPPPPTLADCVAALDAALASGQLKLEDASTSNASPQGRRKAADELRARLAGMVLDKLQQMGSDAVYLSSFPIRLKTATPESQGFEVGSSMDFGPWLAQHGGDQLVAHAAAALPEPDR